MRYKNLSRAALALALTMTALPALAQEITFWSWRQEDKPVYDKIIKSFEDANPGITVKFQAYVPDQYNTILSTALSGGNGPDVMQVRAYGGFETVAGAGYLMPLDSTIIPNLDKFPKAALQAETLRSDGKVYAVPFAAQTMLIIYNKKIFADNGISEPKTWDELMADAKTLKDKGIYPFANGTATAWQNEVLVGALGSTAMGTDFYDDLKAGKVDFTDPRYVSALKHVKEASQYFPDGFIGLDYPSAQQLFVSGMAGMFAGGSYELANFESQNKDLDLGVFAAPPDTAGKPALVAEYLDGGFAGNAKTQHPEAVKKFLAYLASPEFGQVFANELGNISPIPGVTFKNPLLKQVSDLDQNSIPYIMLVDFRYKEPSGSVLLQANVQKMLAGQQTAEQAAEAVTKGIATYYEPFQKLAK